MPVEMRDSHGNPLAEYTADDCIPLKPDENDKRTRFPVRWKNKSDLQELMDRKVQLRFKYRVATLYAYQFADT
tara:strand:- start:167 stop:385 length:219 start_codon:yes stop_codon:yes gene_type:complete